MSQPGIFWWQKFGTLAQMAQAAVALLGFVAILFQINEIRANSRAASARQAATAAVRNGHVYELPSGPILQPGRGSLTEGVRQVHAILARVVGVEAEPALDSAKA